MDWALFKAAADATSNPNPATGLTVAPISISSTSVTPTAAWTAAGYKALFTDGGGCNGSNQFGAPIFLSFFPSAGDAVTYTVTIWRYIRVKDEWVKVAGSDSNNYTGYKSDYISQPGRDPLFIQLSSISSGTIDIYYDRSFATVG